MPLMLVAAMLLAATAATDCDYASPNGEVCVVVRQERASVHRLWAGGYREPLAAFAFGPEELHDDVLVSNDGHIVSHQAVQCEPESHLLTIHRPDGSVVRTLLARDVLTPNDQQWLCRGSVNDVRLDLGDTLRITMLATDGEPARYDTVDIDLETGAMAEQARDHCPAALRVTAEDDVGLPRAIERVMPRYPELADKARVSGVVLVQVTVATDGGVESVSVLKPLPFGLAEAAERAVWQWKFAPGTRRASGVIAFHFEIVRGRHPRAIP